MLVLAAESAATQAELVGALERLTIGQAIGWIGGILFVLSWVIQIVPVKINPWTWIARKIGKAVNKELLDKVDKIEADVSAMQSCINEKNAKDARARILHFGDALIYYPDREYSKDRYDEVLVCITEYMQYCDNHPTFKNHMTEATIGLIEERYRQCLRDGSFRNIG